MWMPRACKWMGACERVNCPSYAPDSEWMSRPADSASQGLLLLSAKMKFRSCWNVKSFWGKYVTWRGQGLAFNTSPAVLVEHPQTSKWVQYWDMSVKFSGNFQIWTCFLLFFRRAVAWRSTGEIPVLSYWSAGYILYIKSLAFFITSILATSMKVQEGTNGGCCLQPYSSQRPFLSLLQMMTEYLLAVAMDAR